MKAWENLEKFSHNTNRKRTCVHHQTKESICMYCNGRGISRNKEDLKPSQPFVFLYSSKIWTTKE